MVGGDEKVTPKMRVVFTFSVNPIYGCFQKYGKTHQIIQFNRVFHYKPSILGYPYFWKHPYSAHFNSEKDSYIEMFVSWDSYQLSNLQGPYDIPLNLLVHRDPCYGSVQSSYHWVVSYPFVQQIKRVMVTDQMDFKSSSILSPPHIQGSNLFKQIWVISRIYPERAPMYPRGSKE